MYINVINSKTIKKLNLKKVNKKIGKIINKSNIMFDFKRENLLFNK